MSAAGKRRYARYITLSLTVDAVGIAARARRNGMQVMQCMKPDMHVMYEVGLYGTPEQMRQTDTDWGALGLEVKTGNRLPKSLVFGVNLQRPREEWLDAPAGPQDQLTSAEEAEQWFKLRRKAIEQEFDRQIHSNVGGLYNPTIYNVDQQGHIEFRCHYDNFEGADDSWTWYLDPFKMEFYN